MSTSSSAAPESPSLHLNDLMIMRNRISIIVLICLCSILYGCGSAAEKAMGPEEVAESFCRAVAAGEFGQARALCDTVTMKDYINGLEADWAMLQKQDSSAFVIALQMMSEIEFNVEDVIKEDDERHLFCSIGIDGNRKGKLIILKKEEGEWKVRETADRP